MPLQSFLARFSIRTQILIGFLPVLVFLLVFALSSQLKFSTFSSDFESLFTSTEEQLIFTEIERDVVELQRGFLVYSFYGYRGILTRIRTMQKKLDEKFAVAREYAIRSPEIFGVYERFYRHYMDFNKGFEGVLKKKEAIRSLYHEQLEPLHENIILTLEDIKSEPSLMLMISELKINQYRQFSKLQSFLATPDASVVRGVRDLHEDTLLRLKALRTIIGDEDARLDQLDAYYDEYEATFTTLIITNNSYLHLVNVVLAGKASEITALSRKLEGITRDNSLSFKADILTVTERSKNIYFVFALLAALLGVGAILYISLGISRPVKDMAQTLSRLAGGDLDAEIPAQGRNDEVGDMAQAAAAFKAMTWEMQGQKTELLESRLKMTSILDNMVDGLITIDDAGKIESFNTACEVLFGYRLDEVIGENISMLMPDPHRSKHDRYLANYSKMKVKNIIGTARELEGMRKDGGVFEMELSVSEQVIGERSLFTGIVRDISERKAIEKDIEDSRKFQALVLNSIPDFMFVKDEHLKIVQANDAFINNYPPERRDKVIGYTTLEEYPADQVKLFTANDRAALDDGYHEAQEDVHMPDGMLRNLITKKVRFVSNGRPFLLGISRDITEMKKAEEEILRSNEELERFAYIASHDLQEPLRMVSSFTGLLKEEYSAEMGDDATQYMNFIMDASERMHVLVADLLEYSRAGDDDAGASLFNANKSITSALLNLNETIKETNADVVIQSEMPDIFVNNVRFARLIQNLVGNAIKYRAPDVIPKVSVGAEDVGDMWEFSVKDNGLGIKGEYLEQIFVIFKRLHNKNEYTGTGIGLSICKKIVESFGGRLWVESEYGKGSVFKFTVPKQKEK